VAGQEIYQATWDKICSSATEPLDN